MFNNHSDEDAPVFGLGHIVDIAFSDLEAGIDDSGEPEVQTVSLIAGQVGCERSALPEQLVTGCAACIENRFSLYGVTTGSFVRQEIFNPVHFLLVLVGAFCSQVGPMARHLAVDFGILVLQKELNHVVRYVPRLDMSEINLFQELPGPVEPAGKYAVGRASDLMLSR